MNFLDHLIQYVVPAVIGGALTWWATSKNDGTQREDVYADHMPEIWSRLDKITQERDDLKVQVESLQDQVSKQSATIDNQSRIIDKLNKSVNELKISVTQNTKELKNDETK